MLYEDPSTVSLDKLESAGFSLLDHYISINSGISTMIPSTFEEDTLKVLAALAKLSMGDESQHRLNLYKAWLLLLQDQTTSGKKILKSLRDSTRRAAKSEDGEDFPEDGAALYLKVSYCEP